MWSPICVHVSFTMTILFQLVMINACLSRLERDTQDLHHQKQEISQQINARHELLTFWADRARDEVGILYGNRRTVELANEFASRIKRIVFFFLYIYFCFYIRVLVLMTGAGKFDSQGRSVSLQHHHGKEHRLRCQGNHLQVARSCLGQGLAGL